MRSTFQRAIYFIVAATLSSTILCAKVPDEEDILMQIMSSKSENYYPSLSYRFERGDSTLTLNNYHYLYYGYAYSDEYKPLATNPYMDKLLTLASGIDVDNPYSETLREIIAEGEKALEYDPFNPKIWNLLAYAYGALGEGEKERAAYRRLEMILEVIINSGNGLKQDSPRHILMFDHAQGLMAAQGLNSTKPRIISRTVEFMPLVSPRKADGVKVRGYFFDFGRVYWNKPDSVTYTRDRTWQFNNLPVREYK